MENEITCIPQAINTQAIKINELRNIHVNHKDLFYLLQQLTSAPEMDKQVYLEVIQNLPKNQYIFVITNNEKPIGMISLLIEQKLIHGGSKVGHIEDVIVDKAHQHKGYATKLIQHTIAVAKLHQCYKCILNCTDEVKPLYDKNGFTKKTNGMSLYFKH